MTARRALAGEAGLSLVELMMAMTLSMIVLFAGLAVFEVFDRGVASTNHLTDAEDSARRDVGEMVRTLRSAGAPAPSSGTQPTAVTRSTATDLVFLSTSWPNESGTGSPAGTNHVQRYCVNTASRELWFGGLRAGAAGSTDPGAACPSQASGWTNSRAATGVVNSASLPLFRYGSTNPVRSVGISLRLERGNAAVSRTLQLSSGGTLRGALAPTTGPGDVAVVCNYDGSGKALVSVATNLKLDATGSVTLGPGKILMGVTGSSTLALTVTNALGLQKLIFKEVTC